MSTAVNSNRNIGLELLRVVSMFAIVILHVLGNGGVIPSCEPLSKGYEAAWLLEVICYFGVSAYALLSGYVGVDGNYHPTNIIYLWLQVMFYNVIATALFFVLMPESRQMVWIVKTLFPISTEAYWYFSAFALTFLLVPALKKAFEHLSKSYLTFILIGLLMFLSFLPVLPFVFNTDVFNLKYGTSFIWVFACWFIGAYIKKFKFFSKYSTSTLWLLYLLGVVVAFGSKAVIEYRYGATAWNRDRGNPLVYYHAPTILLCAVALLLIFERMKLGDRMTKVVKIVAPLSFGVYLFNCQPMIWYYVIPERFSHFASYPVWKMLLCTILSALVIFFIGIAIDAIRNLIFSLGHLKEKLYVIENHIFKD